MKIYLLSPQSIERAKRKAVIRGVVLGGFALALGLVPSVAAGLISIGPLVMAIPIMLVSLVIGIRRALKILDENLKSYQLLVSSDSVIKRQGRLSDVEIHREQITRVEEKPETGLFIRTADKKSFINVPEGLEGMDELKETLSKWRPPDSIISSKERGPLLLAVALLSFGLAFATLWLSTNLALVMAAGIFLIVYTVWGSVALSRRQDVDARLKIKPWLILFLVFAYAMMLYGRLSVLLKH
jgi:hypothetical protein